MKKIRWLFSAVAFLFVILGYDPAYAEEAPTDVSQFEYTIKGSSIYLTKYIGTDKNVVIPNTYTVYDELFQTDREFAVNVGKNTFHENKIIESVNIGNNVKAGMPNGVNGDMGGGFQGCESLKYINQLPANTTLANICFDGCKNLNLQVKDWRCKFNNISGMYGYCKNVNFQNISIDNTVTDIEFAFYLTNIDTNVYLLSDKIAEGRGIFMYSAPNVYYIKNSTTQDTLNNYKYDASMNFSAKHLQKTGQYIYAQYIPFVTLSDWQYTYDSANDTIVLNKYIGSDAKVQISDYAIYNDKATKVVLGTSTPAAGPFVNNKNITEVDFFMVGCQNGNADYMFYGCSNLKEVVNISDTNTNMDHNFVFDQKPDDCDKASEVINGAASMNYTFAGCTSLQSAYVPSASITQAKGCYMNCTSLVTFDGNTRGSGDFSDFAIPSVSDWTDMFNGCSKLTTAPVNTGNVTDMTRTYRAAGLVSLGRIPAGVTKISGICENCTSLAGTVEVENADLTDVADAFTGIKKPVTLHFGRVGTTSEKSLSAEKQSKNWGNITLKSGYTVTFVDDKGTELATYKVNANESVIPPAYEQRYGYTASWSDSCTNITSDKRISLVYTPNVYTVTVKSKGLDNADTNTGKHAYGEKVTLHASTVAGYDFVYWMDANGKKVSESKSYSFTMGDNCIYTAVYEKQKFTVRFYVKNTLVDTQKVLYGSDAKTPVVKADPGYAFTGWNGECTNVTSNRDLKAVFKKLTYSITYKAGTNADNGGNPKKYDVDSSFALKNPVRKGYSFKGWYADKAYKKRIKKIEHGTCGNMTLYAKWSADKYKITYKLNKGKNSKKNPASYRADKPAAVLISPTRKGYAFKGWYKDSKYKKRVTRIEKGSYGNLTLYAKWEKVKVSKVSVTGVKQKNRRQAEIRWKKIKGAAGYEVYSSSSKKGKYRKVKSITATTCKVSVLPRKTSYLKVRAYKLDSTGRKVYGSYSSVKPVKMK